MIACSTKLFDMYLQLQTGESNPNTLSVDVKDQMRLAARTGEEYEVAEHNMQYYPTDGELKAAHQMLSNICLLLVQLRFVLSLKIKLNK